MLHVLCGYFVHFFYCNLYICPCCSISFTKPQPYWSNLNLHLNYDYYNFNIYIMVALLSTLAPREFTDMWSIRPKGQALCIIRVSDRYSGTGWKPGLLHPPWWSIHEVRKCLNRSRPEFECPRTLPGVRNPQSRSSFRLLPPSLVPKRPLPSWIPDRTMDLEATPFMKNKVQNAIFSNRVYKASGHYSTAVHLSMKIFKHCLYEGQHFIQF